MKRNKIIRNISKIDRFIEIYNSMPKPQVLRVTKFNYDNKGNGVPNIRIEIMNENGNCLYIHNIQGLFDINIYEDKYRYIFEEDLTAI